MGIFRWPGRATDLPMLRGYSVRLIVPGHYGTNWVKPVNAIIVADNVFDGFWMSGSDSAAPKTINWSCATA